MTSVTPGFFVGFKVLVDILKTLWLIQVALFVPVTIYLIVNYFRSGPVSVHVVFMASSYVILTLVDVYTIWFENYPVISPKAFAMLASFVAADYGLLQLTMRSLNGGQDDKPLF